MRLDSPPGQGTIRRLSLVTLLSEGKLADRTEPVKSLLSTLIGKYVPRKWLLHLHTLTRHARLAGRSSADDRFARATAPGKHNALERGTVGAPTREGTGSPSVRRSDPRKQAAYDRGTSSVARSFVTLLSR